jgi:ssDNA thymidine ADP-ribosyltransferase DarT-like protein
MITLSAEKAWIFRITHIANIPWILSNGLHCRNSGACDPNYHEIGNPDLIQKRHQRRIHIDPGGTLSDYIPFYFTPYSPMLLNIKTGYNGLKQTAMPEIVILVASLHKLVTLDVRFILSDRHAYLEAAKFANDLSGLDRIDWEILQARDFKRDPDDPGKFERYQAEALIHRHLPVSALTYILCYGPEQRTRLDALVKDAGLTIQVLERPNCYF